VGGSVHRDGGRVDTPGDNLEGLNEVRSDLAMMRTPDGHGAIEPAKFHTPPAVRTAPESAPANMLGIRRIMFTVDDDDVDDVVARLRRHGGELVGEIAQCEDIYRLCLLRGPEGIFIGRPTTSAEPSEGAVAGGRGGATSPSARSPRWELKPPSRSQRGGSDIAPNAPSATATRAKRSRGDGVPRDRRQAIAIAGPVPRWSPPASLRCMESESLRRGRTHPFPTVIAVAEVPP
jgi:hypothetical protein